MKPDENQNLDAASAGNTHAAYAADGIRFYFYDAKLL